jgi:hypothetical protein
MSKKKCDTVSLMIWLKSEKIETVLSTRIWGIFLKSNSEILEGRHNCALVGSSKVKPDFAETTTAR